MESERKRSRKEDYDLKEMIFSMQDTFFNKLKSIEEKVDEISLKYQLLEKKVDNIMCDLQGIPVNNSGSLSNYPGAEKYAQSDSSDDDYPNGSWLGDPENPDFRVRCPISPKDLDHINDSCLTPGKMSLKLLDYLFPREVQACSNLSGSGMHGKKQLDPEKVFGIKCHVTYMFGISEKDWDRIKLNIDSKCRTAFRRKSKGMPLNIRGSRARSLYKLKKKDEDSEEILYETSSDSYMGNEVFDGSESQPVQKSSEGMLPENSSDSNVGHEVFEGLESQPEPESSLPHVFPVEVQTLNLEVESTTEDSTAQYVLPVQIEDLGHLTFPISSKSEIIHTKHGKIQVIRATKEQFELFKQGHNIQVLPQTSLPS